ncbi:hypothetical protein XAP6164_3930005 [Xanthomonas phaseoli pv. phaseoli]|nr:hypothetical protein XAP6164_3930005 [Xanthomonas phaseoli pv. phaseoli]
MPIPDTGPGALPSLCAHQLTCPADAFNHASALRPQHDRFPDHQHIANHHGGLDRKLEFPKQMHATPPQRQSSRATDHPLRTVRARLTVADDAAFTSPDRM